MPFPGGTYLALIRPAIAWVADEFDQFYALLEGYLRVEHNEDGTHRDLTASSVTVTGAVTADGAGTFDGNVVADADGAAVTMGAIAGSGSIVGAAGIQMQGTLTDWEIAADEGSSPSRRLVFVDRKDNTKAYIFRIGLTGSDYILEPSSGTSVFLGNDTSGRRVAAVNTSALRNAGLEAQTSALSPAQITANQNNYNPLGLDTARVLRLSVDAARTITGLAAQPSGTRLTLLNVTGGAGFDITLAHADTVNSTAANVFICPGFVGYTLARGGGVDIWYDGTSSVWRVVA